MYTQEEIDFKNNLYLALLKYFSKFSDIELNRMMLMHDCISTNEIKSCVYFILDRERKLVKIGKTKNLTDRFSQITNAYRFCGLDYKNKLDLISIFWCLSDRQAAHFESLFHEKFIEYHVDLEWYRYDEKALYEMIKSVISTNTILYMMDDFQYVIVDNDTWNNNSSHRAYTCDIRDLSGFDKITALASTNIEYVVNVYYSVLWTIESGYYEYIKDYEEKDMFGEFWTGAFYYWYYQSVLCPEHLFKYLLLNSNSKAIKKIKSVKPSYEIKKTKFYSGLNDIVSFWNGNKLYYYFVKDGKIKNVNLKECFGNMVSNDSKMAEVDPEFGSGV